MARRDWSARLDRVTFRCAACLWTWESVPDLIEDDPESPHHPFKYFANCTACGTEHQPQVAWERALMKAHQEATGPITPEGKAASAANLAGHPTPAEAHITRFNAMKHGMHARVATFFPAKPDKYPFCSTCDVERGWCEMQPACVKQTELFMRHHAAVEQRNPKHLGQIHADLMAALTAALQLCLQAVLGDGVVIKTPRVELSKDGSPVAMKWTDGDGVEHQIYDYAANPVFKPIADLITRLGLSMGDQGLTPRAQEEEEEELGALSGMGKAKREDLLDFQQRMLVAVDGMREKLGRAGQRLKADPVLIEHQAQGDRA